MSKVIIIGGGASVAEGIEKGLWDKIKGSDIVSLNSVFKVMPYLPTMQMWVDKDFFRHDVDELQKLHMQGVKLIAREHLKLKPFVNEIEMYETSRERKNYFGKDAIKKRMIFYGSMGLSGMFGLSYCIAAGYTDIYLLGYDFGTTSINNLYTHWYQNKLLEKNIYSTGAAHPEVYLLKQQGGQVNPFIEDFTVYKQETDINIWNVSPSSNIPYFTKINYDGFFERIKDANTA